MTILVCSDSVIRGGCYWFPTLLEIANFQTFPLWWSSSFANVVIRRYGFIHTYKHVSKFKDKLQKRFLIIFWDALLYTMMAVQDPCIYFAYVNTVPKYLDTPSTCFDSNMIQCNKHVCQINTPIPLLYIFTTCGQGIGTHFLCCLLNLSTAVIGSTSTKFDTR